MELSKQCKEKIDNLCKESAYRFLFCNVGEQNFPNKEEIETMLSNDNLYNEETKKELIVWEPFEDYDGENLLDILNTAEYAYRETIMQALKIIEEEKKENKK